MCGPRCFPVDTSCIGQPAATRKTEAASSTPHRSRSRTSASGSSPRKHRLCLLRVPTGRATSFGSAVERWWPSNSTAPRSNPVGEPRPIADGVGVVVAAAHMAVAVSTNGTLLYASPGPERLTWFDRAGKRLGTVGDPGLYAPNSFRISPDGSQIAATRVEAGRDLWLIDAERGTSRRTTYDSGGGYYPQWSPDGRTLLFLGENISALHRKDAAGAAPGQRLATWPVSNLTDWSRDGGFLLYTQTAETKADIWVVPVTPDGHLVPELSPGRICARRSMNPRPASHPNRTHAGSRTSQMRVGAPKSTSSPSPNHAARTGSRRMAARHRNGGRTAGSCSIDRWLARSRP